MKIIRNSTALLLAFALVLSFAACGQKSSGGLLKARFSVLFENDTLEQMLADPAAHEAEINAFGLDDFAATFPDADAYRSYTVEISVENLNDFDVELINVQMETKKQGTNNVWFSGLAEVSSVGFPAHYTGDEALYYTVIASALLSKQEILQTLGEMGISCVYMKGSDVPAIDEDIDPSLLYTSDILYEEG